MAEEQVEKAAFFSSWRERLQEEINLFLPTPFGRVAYQIRPGGKAAIPLTAKFVVEIKSVRLKYPQRTSLLRMRKSVRYSPTTFPKCSSTKMAYHHNLTLE